MCIYNRGLPAIYSRIPDTEGVSLVEWGTTECTGEAVNVEHQISCTHNQLRRRYRSVASGAAFGTV